jgi:hypothetical protein
LQRLRSLRCRGYLDDPVGCSPRRLHAEVRWLASSAVEGHCGEIERAELGDCAAGNRGQLLRLPFPTVTSNNLWALAAHQCLTACRACERCRYVSISLLRRDCNWYFSCWRAITFPRGSISGAVKPNRTALGATAALDRPVASLPQPTANRTWRDRLKVSVGRWHRLAAGRGRGRAAGRNAEISWPWLTMNSSARVAFMLFGAISGVSEPSSSDTHGSEHVVRAAYESLRTHVLDANPLAHHAFFCHSWNPNLRTIVDSLYAPHWSLHEPRQMQLNKVQSAALSLRKALAAALAASKAEPFTLIAALRYDLIWLNSLRWAEMPTAQLWFFSFCCEIDPNVPPLGGFGAHPEMARWGQQESRRHTSREAPCGNKPSRVASICRLSTYTGYGGQQDAFAEEEDLSYFVNDWGFFAPPTTAATFALISERYEVYDAALAELNIHPRWMHFVFALHVQDALGISAGVRGTLYADVDVIIHRIARTHRWCRANTSLGYSDLRESSSSMESDCSRRHGELGHHDPWCDHAAAGPRKLLPGKFGSATTFMADATARPGETEQSAGTRPLFLAHQLCAGRGMVQCLWNPT